MSIFNQIRRGDRNRHPRSAYSPSTADDRQIYNEHQAAVRRAEQAQQRLRDQQAAAQRVEDQRRRNNAALSPLARRPVTATFPLRHYLGSMDAVCDACGALHFEDEKSTTQPASSPTPFRQCCQFGTVDLQPFPEPPLMLKGLLRDQTPGEYTLRDV